MNWRLPPDGPSLFVEDARGWPMLSMCSLTREDSPTFLRGIGNAAITSDGHVLNVSNAAVRNLWVMRIVPLRPIWPGFIINTLLYALLLWLLFATPFTARRMLRRKRGLCEKCAYPIGVNPVCTECGAAVSR